MSGRDSDRWLVSPGTPFSLADRDPRDGCIGIFNRSHYEDVLIARVHEREEQAERPQARLDDPTKRWKLNRADLAERERWDDYAAASADAIQRTSSEHAPWHVMPADRKWFRNWAVSRIVTEALEAMGPRYPAPAEDLDGVVVT